MITVRRFARDDWPVVWSVLEPVFRAGETYAFAPDISETEAYKVWIEVPTATFVAQDDSGAVLGTYYLKPNQPSLGAHVCNCGYVVADQARGQGIATTMCEHSQREAAARGFGAMQFNLVVCSNEGAIRLWKKHGYQIAGRLPGAFRHPTLGFIDALVMYKQLAT